MFDVVIRQGTVVDGTGAAAHVADVAVHNDRIAAIGDLSQAEASTTIHAQGRLVCPGFIDAHSHSDTYLLLEPDAPSKLSQGVTTEINGQCGGSAAPRFGVARLPSDWASRVYPSLAAEPSTQPGPTWSTVAEYRALFDAVKPAINTVQFIGHNTLRAGVMGYEPCVATADDVALMQQRLEQALDEGGWGLTTGLLYQPGKYAQPQEIEALARTVAARGGLYATHMRSEGERLLESVDEVLRLARATGIHVQISHLKTSGRNNWFKIDALLEKLNAARAEGVWLHSDRYPYVAAGTDLDIVLPEWASAGGNPVILKTLRDPALRLRVEAELNASERTWSEVMVGGCWSDTTRPYQGRCIAELCEEFGVSPGEIVCRIIDADDCRTGAFFFGMSEENLRRIYAQPWIMPGSDASLRAPWGVLGIDWPHPRAYGTMARFYRTLTGGDGKAIASREETIRRMTSLPAHAFGIDQRGVIRCGAYADLVVLNESAFADRATYEAPHQFCTGIEQVFVNGCLSYDQGSFTGQRRGRFLVRSARS